MYDLLGDIHGHVTALKALLAKMDYQEVGSVWQHSERKVMFLADFFDRGPEQVETVEIAKKMIEIGSFPTVMGSHEFTALAWAPTDREKPHCFPRRHTEKNLQQHREFIQQVSENRELHKSFIDGFKTSPAYPEPTEVRSRPCMLASRIPHKMDKYRDYLRRIFAGAWEQFTCKDNKVYNAIETPPELWLIRLFNFAWYLLLHVSEVIRMKFGRLTSTCFP